jgi:hypothetical protein
MNRRVIAMVTGTLLVLVVVFVAVQLLSDAHPDRAATDRSAAPPPQPTLHAALREPAPVAVPVSSISPTPSSAPKPPATVVPTEPGTPAPEVVTMPTATGTARFDDGRPVADASIRVTSPGDRLVVGAGATDGQGRFSIVVPGFGPGEYWFEDHGLQFWIQAPLGDSAEVVVPTFQLRVRVEPATEPAVLTLVSPAKTPASMWMHGVAPPAEPSVVYMSSPGKSFGGRQEPITGEIDLRLPVVSRLILWASTAHTARASNGGGGHLQVNLGVARLNREVRAPRSKVNTEG